MGDMKGEIQQLADDIAFIEHDCGYYDLPEPLQRSIYDRAVVQWNDKQADKADRMNDEQRTEGTILVVKEKPQR